MLNHIKHRFGRFTRKWQGMLTTALAVGSLPILGTVNLVTEDVDHQRGEGWEETKQAFENGINQLSELKVEKGQLFAEQQRAHILSPTPDTERLTQAFGQVADQVEKLSTQLERELYLHPMISEADFEDLSTAYNNVMDKDDLVDLDTAPFLHECQKDTSSTAGYASLEREQQKEAIKGCMVSMEDNNITDGEKGGIVMSCIMGATSMIGAMIFLMESRRLKNWARYQPEPSRLSQKMSERRRQREQKKNRPGN